ncbi:MAG TPA: metallophosphoesterase [Gemmataceae bacterium]|nr:metallophosphoesterase [Gemmataceae bacterium]
MTVRLAHFSDVHLTVRPLGWRVRDLFGKRLSGWVNVKFLGRGRRFQHANAVVEGLLREFRERPLDHLVFSGDATTMAFENEMTEAARRLGVEDTSLPPCIAVPGNHDLYTFGASRRRVFEFAFSAWQQGERADPDHTYPFAKKVGHVWLIALNSSTANLWPWDATGKVGEAQLERFRRLVAKLDPGPRVVLSHYPLLTKHRKPEAKWHRLRDWARVRDAAAECGVSLWLHGHKHAWYWLPAGEHQPFPSIDVGSSTQTDRWGYHEYTIDGWTLRGLRRVYDPDTGQFKNDEMFELELAR